MGKTRAWFGLGATMAVLNAGCDVGGSASDPASPEGPSGIGSSKVALERAVSCDDLAESLRADASSKMNRRIDAEIRAIKEGYTYWARGPFDSSPAPGAPVTPGATATPDAAESPTPAHSETETQVKGVDEADIVKADGTRLYVLHGQRLLIVNAWPAANLSLVSGTDIEGEPQEMFVTGKQAVVFSRTDGEPVYRAAGVTPRESYSDAYDTGVYPAADIAIAPGWGSGVFASGLTKVTVLALEGDTATVTRELYFEGAYQSSRRIEDQVRVVLQGGAHGPVLDYAPVYSADPSGSPDDAAIIRAWEALRVKNQAAIDRTTYADWVPQSFIKADGGVTAVSTACADFYVPTEGSTEFGMTELVTFDLAAPARAPSMLAIVGSAEIVYGNASSMVVASNAYVDPWSLRQAAYQPDSASIPVETLNATHVHRFDFDADSGAPTYTASGSVPGSAPDQFALDATADHVRIITNELRSGPYRVDGKQNQVTHVHVLENRDGRLEIEGKAGEIAPGEQLYATRFVGDMAYVVTWHVTDPLFVIDLHDPANPTVLGELHIPGFSEYMRPLDATHLLTIGRETDDTGHQHTDDGYWYGISIQVFDVTDPLKPLLQHKYVYDGGDYATTEATQNHKAFTYFEDRKLLAFPYVRQYGYGATSDGPSSALEVFRVDVESGIQKLGSVEHSSLLETQANGLYGYCGGYYDGAVRRGVFFEDVVYSVSYGGIEASDVSDLGTPLATLKLASPTMQGLSCGGGAP
jgi:hypothetical protein